GNRLELYGPSASRRRGTVDGRLHRLALAPRAPPKAAAPRRRRLRRPLALRHRVLPATRRRPGGDRHDGGHRQPAAAHEDPYAKERFMISMSNGLPSDYAGEVESKVRATLSWFTTTAGWNADWRVQLQPLSGT